MRAVVSSDGEMHVYKEAKSKGRAQSSSSWTDRTIRNLHNPVYTGDSTTSSRPSHDYESMDTVHSSRNEEPERKFKNPIYGDESVVRSRSVQYDQLGNIYHTLENEEDRAHRYAEATQLTAFDPREGDNCLREEQEKPVHRYEDVK